MTAIQKKQDDNVKTMIANNMGAIKNALPSHLKPERMARILFNEIGKNPELQLCDQISLMGAVLKCSELGLEPGGAHQHVYLIPFYNKKKGIKEVNIIVSYQGLMELAKRAGCKRIFADVVREKDAFQYEQGFDVSLRHRISQGDRGAITHAYALAVESSGEKVLVVLDLEEINAAMDASKTGGAIWSKHYAAMAKKTAVRRLSKWLRLSAEDDSKTQFERAIDVDSEEIQKNAEFIAEKANIKLPPEHTEKEPRTLNFMEKVKPIFEDAIRSGLNPKEVFGKTADEILKGITSENDCVNVINVIKAWKEKHDKA